MPASRKRKTGHPARTAKPMRPTPVTAARDLEVTTLAILEQSFSLVQKAEERLLAAIREGGDTAELQEVHHHLRTGALGLLTAYSLMADLPDPRKIYLDAQA